MPFGVMGGAYQAVGHAHVVTNRLDYGMDVQQALDSPRAFPAGKGVEVEHGLSAAAREGLAARGHEVKDRSCRMVVAKPLSSTMNRAHSSAAPTRAKTARPSATDFQKKSELEPVMFVAERFREEIGKHIRADIGGGGFATLFFLVLGGVRPCPVLIDILREEGGDGTGCREIGLAKCSMGRGRCPGKRCRIAALCGRRFFRPPRGRQGATCPLYALHSGHVFSIYHYCRHCGRVPRWRMNLFLRASQESCRG